MALSPKSALWRIATLAFVLGPLTGALAQNAVPVPAPVPGQVAPPAPAGSESEASAQKPAETGPLVYRANVIARYPHDTGAYTQGLLWHDGFLYESTGREGQSRVRKVDLATGDVLQENHIPAAQFGEGMALWRDELISLTWRDGVVHRWNLADLSPVSSFDAFPFEGWGITTSDEGLIFSDGSSTLRVIDPETYDVTRSINVTLRGRPIAMLNELELVDGLVLANVWQTGYILGIDPADGVVQSIIDLRPLVAEIDPQMRDDVLNGIAWDAGKRRLFVTGKHWPTLFEIKLVEADAKAP